MERGAWWAIVCGVAESEMTEVTKHEHITKSQANHISIYFQEMINIAPRVVQLIIYIYF